LQEIRNVVAKGIVLCFLIAFILCHFMPHFQLNGEFLEVVQNIELSDSHKISHV